ncbi:hypothetical protein CAEBREN_08530 [Caenorhabditis brenneri]|uniref:Uncharacterized protein n=1 Tax=Caenorhabditis brenneri TaxID=135651 RepID=G0NDB4_CAEBE|nr:hypothetical protein CAEBREN_08530 [Caenorhabditis brenneri]
MKRTRTRAPLTTLIKIDRVQVVQIMEDMLNVVASGFEKKNNPQVMYDDKTEVRKVMGYLLNQVVHIKPKRIRKPRIETESIQEQPVVEEDLPFVPKTLKEIQRDGWDFNDFVVSLPLLVSKEEIDREALKVNLYFNESLSSLSQVADNQLRGEPPKKRSRPSKVIKIHNSDLSTLPNDEKSRSQIMTPENVVSE